MSASVEYPEGLTLVFNIGSAYSPVVMHCQVCQAHTVRRVPIDEEMISLWQKDNTHKSVWHNNVLNIGL